MRDVETRPRLHDRGGAPERLERADSGRRAGLLSAGAPGDGGLTSDV